MAFNRVTLLGYSPGSANDISTKDESRCEFTLIYKGIEKSDLGQVNEIKEAHHIVCKGALARLCLKHIQPGKDMILEGELRVIAGRTYIQAFTLRFIRGILSQTQSITPKKNSHFEDDDVCV